MDETKLPLFPLPIALFPGAAQALHVFEPRYRTLLRDCLAGDRRFGLSFLPPGADGDTIPQAGDVGCASVIQQHQPLPDGRSNIVTVGETRYTIVELVQADRPYLVASVDFYQDDPADEAGLSELSAEVRALYKEFVTFVQTLTDTDGEGPEPATDPVELSFQVAAQIEADPVVKETLLRTRSTPRRLGQLRSLLKPLNKSMARRAAEHQRAKSNGRGSHTPQLASGDA